MLSRHMPGSGCTFFILFLTIFVSSLNSVLSVVIYSTAVYILGSTRIKSFCFVLPVALSTLLECQVHPDPMLAGWEGGTCQSLPLLVSLGVKHRKMGNEGATIHPKVWKVEGPDLSDLLRCIAESIDTAF